MARVFNTGRAIVVSMADFNDRVRLLLERKPALIKPEGRRKTPNWSIRPFPSK